MHVTSDARRNSLVLVSTLVTGMLGLLACGGGSRSVGTTGPITGSLSVTTSTTGQDLDPDGYVLSVDGGQWTKIGVNETDTLQDLAAGSHEIDLTGVRANCQVTGSVPRTVTVEAGATASTTFEAACEHALVDQIAFERRLTVNDGEVYVVNSDGSDPVDLTNDPADDQEPAIAPDGTKIAFQRIRYGEGHLEI